MNSCLITGARVALGAARSARLEIEVRAGRIAARGGSGAGRPRGPVLDLHGCLLLPGLINAHDHLEFALFPRLGLGPYPSARAWALDIHQPDRSPIREQLQVPRAIRLRWGGLRNLLAGVTTVCHHNPRYAVFSRRFPVRVPREIGWAHSLQFGRDPAASRRRTPPSWPFVIHLGEATGSEGAREIFDLDARGVLDDRTVIVHAVGCGARGLELALKRRAAIVWCPSSNLHILGKTLGSRALVSGIPMALGTDSSLSGDGDLLDELRLARRNARLTAERLYEMVTTAAAQIMRLHDGEGAIRTGGVADLVAVADRGKTPADSLLEMQAATMEMVMVGGRVQLASPRLAGQLPAATMRNLHPLEIESAHRRRLVLLSEDIPRLLRIAEATLGAVTLAGKRVRQAQPVFPSAGVEND